MSRPRPDRKIESRPVWWLDGIVRSWAEHDEAVAAAWAAPGVSGVDDQIDVVY
jgi:osmotically-inducible protein OsmY